MSITTNSKFNPIDPIVGGTRAGSNLNKIKFQEKKNLIKFVIVMNLRSIIYIRTKSQVKRENIYFNRKKLRKSKRRQCIMVHAHANR